MGRLKNQTSSLVFFPEADIADFREWLGLNISSITWQGRYEREFEQFWHRFFTPELSFQEILKRFFYAKERSPRGPLLSWFEWLEARFIVYTFIKKDLSVLELSELSLLGAGELAFILRNYFLEIAPHLESMLSDKFQIQSVCATNVDIRFSVLQREFDLEDRRWSGPDEIMSSIEVTLYRDFRKLLKKMRRDFGAGPIALAHVKRSLAPNKQLRFLQEALVLILIGTFLVYALRWGNELYKDYLREQISIYGPQYKWPRQRLRYRVEREKGPLNSKELPAPSLDIATKLQSDFLDKAQENDGPESFQTESEVVLSSWTALPKDFETADLEKSKYEDLRASGFRDTRFGQNTVYRVMMNSIYPEDAKQQLLALLVKYNVGQADYVKPGQEVPGGVYFNLNVPSSYLKEFLSQVGEVDESTFYLSRTNNRNVPGHSRVFIWVMNI